MTYGNFKNLTTRTGLCKFLRNKAFNMAKNLICDGYRRGLTFMVYRFFDTKSSGMWY